MQQRIAVRALITDSKQRVLLLRRSGGRATIMGKFELPGGRMEYGEQPEDSLAHHLQADTGATLRAARLLDVVSYIDHDDRDIQYIFILYSVTIDNFATNLALGQGYDRYLWKGLAALQQSTLTESTRLLLGISQQNITSVQQNELIGQDVAEETTGMQKVIVYSDGGSRGNPGPSAAGFVVMNSQEHVIHEGGMYLGITTNNMAEYHGVRLALEKALSMGVATVECRVDSMLVVNQMNGSYTIKNRELWPVYERIKELTGHFDKVSFVHVKREYNQLADGMVNKILNAHARQ